MKARNSQSRSCQDGLSFILQDTELHSPPSYFTSDCGAAKASVQKLAALVPNVVAPGLHKLADDFERIAVWDNKK